MYVSPVSSNTTEHDWSVWSPQVAKLGELPQVHDAQLVGVGNVCELLTSTCHVQILELSSFPGHQLDTNCPEHPAQNLGSLRILEFVGSDFKIQLRLVVVDNAAVLHTVRTRYKRTDIYTFARTSETVSYDSKQQLLWAKVSKMLVAVNPFRELAVYSKDTLLQVLMWFDVIGWQALKFSLSILHVLHN